jgi:hypothetical protein
MALCTFASLSGGTALAVQGAVVVACLLVFAVYVVLAHWAMLLQGSSAMPLLGGVAAFVAASPAIGWPLALVAFAVDPGCLMYALHVVRRFRDEPRRHPTYPR